MAYTVHDVIQAECNLEPMVCLHCGSHEVAFDQHVCDAYCQDCGRWQLDEDEWFEDYYSWRDKIYE